MIKSTFLIAALISCSFIYGSASSPSKHDIAAVLQSVNVRVDVALTEQGALEPVQQAFVRTRTETKRCHAILQTQRIYRHT